MGKTLDNARKSILARISLERKTLIEEEVLKDKAIAELTMQFCADEERKDDRDAENFFERQVESRTAIDVDAKSNSRTVVDVNAKSGSNAAAIDLDAKSNSRTAVDVDAKSSSNSVNIVHVVGSQDNGMRVIASAPRVEREASPNPAVPVKDIELLIQSSLERVAEKLKKGKRVKCQTCGMTVRRCICVPPPVGERRDAHTKEPPLPKPLPVDTKHSARDDGREK
ncbi:MAG TPA: hypothetical protein VEF04_19840, partial [Blastocatellia bacterium]|nr:hypothetical protein [Blastocatellia bacterium]